MHDFRCQASSITINVMVPVLVIKTGSVERVAGEDIAFANCVE